MINQEYSEIMKKKVLVIGGGASGMTAAIFAARQGAEVKILERMDRVGKKLLSTGNGKCNLTNRRMDAECYRCGRADFPMQVLERFGTAQTLSFFGELGVVIKDRDGYLYPYSGQASAVLDVLRMELKKRCIEIVTDCQVEKIVGQERRPAGQNRDGRYQVLTSHGTFCADALILAAGSKAAPGTGSDGSGYCLAKSLGLSVIPPLPALVQLRCRENFYKQISGIRTDARVFLWSEGRMIAEDRGELQLTDYGISGIPVFQVSRFAARALAAGQRVEAVLDFYPGVSYDQTKALLESRQALLGDKSMEDFFTGWFPKKLSALFLKLSGVPKEQRADRLGEREREILLNLCKQFKTEVSGTNPFENAQTCCGGVDVSQINPKTMEVKNRKGLFLAGELLDVDGICGGYNLQWAWSTGAIAGTCAGMKE